MTLTKRPVPDPIDIHVGKRIKLRRTLVGISQERLANALGLTFQQVQKYECGTNRVSASKLYEIAKALDIEVAFFFDELPSTTKAAEALQDPMHSAFAMRLVQAARRVDPASLEHLMALVERLPRRTDGQALQAAAE
jgi:transcriptional regulator with XRE-family HTH domain